MESGWFVVIGAAVGVIPTLLTGWLTKRAEKQKQLREMALKVALAEHERTMEIAKFTKGPKVIPPSYTHIPMAYMAVRKCMSGEMKPEDIPQYYEELARLIEENTNGAIQHLMFGK